jgi:hypothetical protein
MNADETVDEVKTEIADENSPEPIVTDHPKLEPAKSRFAELLKAIEHWVQTR